MPLDNTVVEEAKRQLTVCNACRYCEGYCAVFRALVRRSVVDDKDIPFLADLCHDCRGCYQACMFTPPHKFAVNVPLTLSEARLETYAAYAWPQRLGAWFRRSTVVSAVAGVVGLLAMLAVALLSGGPARLMRADTAGGSFYQIIPFAAMVVPALALSIWALLVLILGSIAYVRGTGARFSLALSAASWEALGDAITLRWLNGAGDGCYYPDEERTSGMRRVLHSLVLWGFVSAFVATVAASIEQDLLGIQPPFDVLSIPVVLGTTGGVAMVVGTTGLLVQKARSPRDLLAGDMRTMDVAFIVAIDVVSITGLLLLALRGTPLLSAMLVLHLAPLTTLYVTAPYGKLTHAVYRILALLQDHVEAYALEGPAPRATDTVIDVARKAPA
ncbi:MAG: tricarballylate utilization 4Fe-4S protein TcuB [Chloroflexota bacterium]|nr:tricarballylate utilization 4Fe-4S protein TcuB [Chloroflexota bacterium]